MRYVWRTVTGVFLLILFGTIRNPAEAAVVRLSASILAAVLLYWVFFRRAETRIVLSKGEDNDTSLPQRIKNHRVNIAGSLGVIGLLLLASGVGMWLLFAGAISTDIELAQALLDIVGVVVLPASFIVGLVSLITAFGVYQHRTWGSYMGRLLAFIYAPAFPVGTALGCYMWWYLESPTVQETL